jgi:probable HAF family extracellular repeat protein
MATTRSATRTPRDRLPRLLALLPLLALLAGCLSSTPLEAVGGPGTRPEAVNGHGVIVGSTFLDGRTVAFTRDPTTGALTEIPSFAGGSAVANDVNDHGVVVGQAFFALFEPCPEVCPIPYDHAFVWDPADGELIDLADLGVGAVPPGSGQVALAATALGINDAGVVVGTAVALGPPTFPGTPFSVYPRGFAVDLTTGVVTDLSVYGLNSAVDVNERGQVLGQLGAVSGQAAVVDLATGAVTTIGTFGGTSSTGHALNDEGLVVGTAQVEGNIASHAFVYDLATGELTDIGTLQPTTAAPSSTAYGVSNDGIVVGISATQLGHLPFAYDVPTRTIKGLLPDAPDVVYARDINDAGLTVGYGLGPPEEGWMATVTRHY